MCPFKSNRIKEAVLTDSLLIYKVIFNCLAKKLCLAYLPQTDILIFVRTLYVCQKLTFLRDGDNQWPKEILKCVGKCRVRL